MIICSGSYTAPVTACSGIRTVPYNLKVSVNFYQLSPFLLTGVTDVAQPE